MDFVNKKILVTGGGGFLGKKVIQKLEEYSIPKKNIYAPSSSELDLIKWKNCQTAVKGRDVVIHLAGKSGGIKSQTENPGEMFYNHLIMGAQITEAARQEGVEKFVGIGTVCSYPKITHVPFREETLWDGYPEDTNAPYGLAKKMMLVQAQAYRKQYDFNAIHLLLVNMYGPGDNFDPVHSHVVAALIKKVDDAISSGNDYIEVWGSGNASREFLYVDDAAEGIVLATKKYDKSDPVNLGAGMEITIKDLVSKLVSIMDFKGEIRWDTTKPEGQPRRGLDTSRAIKAFGFKAQTSFNEGLKKTIDWYRENRFSQI